MDRMRGSFSKTENHAISQQDSKDDGVVRALSFLQPPRRVQETVCVVASFNQLDLSYESEKGAIGTLPKRQRRKVNAGANEVRGTDAAIDLILQGENLERAKCLYLPRSMFVHANV